MFWHSDLGNVPTAYIVLAPTLCLTRFMATK